MNHLPGWRRASLLRAVSRPMEDRLFDAVVRHRHALSGHMYACQMPLLKLGRHFVKGASFPGPVDVNDQRIDRRKVVDHAHANVRFPSPLNL